MSIQPSSSGGTPSHHRLPAGMPPAVAERVAEVIAAEDRLVADALEQLGHEMPPRRTPPLSELREQVLDGTPRRTVPVAVGSMVTTGPGPDDYWAVVGSGGADRLVLAQPTETGGVRQTTRRWASLVERNANLLDGPIADAVGGQWYAQNAEYAVTTNGRAAPVELRRDPAVSGAERAWERVRTTWDDVLRGTDLTRRRPVVVTPRTEDEVNALRFLVGDTHLVESRVGMLHGLRTATIATDTRPGAALDVLADAQATQRWFHDRVGIDVWRSDQGMVAVTDSYVHVANASAEFTNDVAITTEGPRDTSLRQTWIRRFGGETGDAVRNTADPVRSHELVRRFRRDAETNRANSLAIRTHEAAHVALMREWGTHELEALISRTHGAAALTEFGVVHEAFADLLGAARAGSPNTGFRQLGRLANGSGSLDQLRASIARIRPRRFDVHVGAQLLTRPMVQVQRQLGSDALAAITGTAIRDIGSRIRSGAITTVDLPIAAQALLDATAGHAGAGDKLAGALEGAWKLLKVLR